MGRHGRVSHFQPPTFPPPQLSTFPHSFNILSQPMSTNFHFPQHTPSSHQHSISLSMSHHIHIHYTHQTSSPNHPEPGGDPEVTPTALLGQQGREEQGPRVGGPSGSDGSSWVSPPRTSTLWCRSCGQEGCSTVVLGLASHHLSSPISMLTSSRSARAGPALCWPVAKTPGRDHRGPSAQISIIGGPLQSTPPGETGWAVNLPHPAAVAIFNLMEGTPATAENLLLPSRSQVCWASGCNKTTVGPGRGPAGQPHQPTSAAP